jgi:hypothetical protein
VSKFSVGLSRISQLTYCPSIGFRATLKPLAVFRPTRNKNVIRSGQWIVTAYDNTGREYQYKRTLAVAECSRRNLSMLHKCFSRVNVGLRCLKTKTVSHFLRNAGVSRGPSLLIHCHHLQSIFPYACCTDFNSPYRTSLPHLSPNPPPHFHPHNPSTRPHPLYTAPCPASAPCSSS